VELLTSDEFARWFAAQEERRAADVATTLEVIAQLGVEKEAPGSTDWVTWYEHPLAPRIRDRGRLHIATADGSYLAHTVPATLKRLVDEWGVFVGYSKRVIKQLESKAFVARLAVLAPHDAQALNDAVARIKKTVTRRTLAFAEIQMKRHLTLREPTPATVREIERLLDLDEIRSAYLAALAAAGFEMVDVPAHSQSLREIAVRAPEPGFRLLYGIDVPKCRGFVAIGEALDRSFYGDSVRRAERLWEAFLRADRTDVEGADAPRMGEEER
jgi:hypothetical protein